MLFNYQARRAVNGVGGNYMRVLGQKCHVNRCDSGHARCGGEAGIAVFKDRNGVFERFNRGVSETRIFIALYFAREFARAVFGR